MEKYFLMNKDRPVASAMMEQESIGSDLRIEKVLGKLPIGLDEHTLTQWVENRKASKHNHHLRALMQECHCDTLDGFIRVTHAASINDTFWIKQADEPMSWQQVSLYRNDFDKSISRLAFEGLGIPDIELSSTSPELTTDGSFRKCFRKEEGEIFLYKRGTSEASNAGLEPYSEVLASEIAKQVCNSSVSYELVTLHDEISSRCKLFTDEKYGYVPMSAFTRDTTPTQLLQFMRSLSEESEESFRAMLVCDAIIFNTDRHLGNVGVLVDNDTVQPIKMAPVFDYNLSLFPYASVAELQAPGDMLLAYTPIIGNDFTRVAQQAMTDAIRDRVKGLEGFQFSYRGDANFPESRIKLLEKIVNQQIDAVLSQNILRTKDVFVPVQYLQREQQAAEAAKRLDAAYEVLDRIDGFIISVTQDSGNQMICIEPSDEDASNPSVYIDFLKNTVRAEQDGMRISEQTLPQNYKDAINAIGWYIGRSRENKFIMLCGIPGSGKTEQAKAEANTMLANGIVPVDMASAYSVERGILDINAASYDADTFIRQLRVQNENEAGTYCIISSHDIREEIRQHGYKDNEDLVQLIIKARIKTALAQGRNVIFDATNTDSRSRINYLSMAKELQTGTCQLDLCVVPLQQHSTFVPADVCASLYEHLQNHYPSKNEGWDNIVEIKQQDRLQDQEYDWDIDR